MEKTVLNVDGMSCQHCVKAVTDAVSALGGVIGVTVDLDTGLVTVEHPAGGVTVEAIRAAIEEQGYDVI